jgi:hypothetical protein
LKHVNKLFLHCKLYQDKILIPVTAITRKTAKAMLPPSYHPSLIP